MIYFALFRLNTSLVELLKDLGLHLLNMKAAAYLFLYQSEYLLLIIDIKFQSGCAYELAIHQMNKIKLNFNLPSLEQAFFSIQTYFLKVEGVFASHF